MRGAVQLDCADFLKQFWRIFSQDLGTVGRLFGALISKAGIPVPTEITQKVLTGAQHIGQWVLIFINK